MRVDYAADSDAATRAGHWHVLWTRSNAEQKVHDQLAGAGFEVFLPKVGRWSRRRGQRRVRPVPLFPGYLFLRHAMDRGSYLRIARARGLVRVLGSRWDRLEAVPEREIDAIRRVLDSDLPRMPHRYLQAGQQVRIVEGPLRDVRGTLVRADRRSGLLVLSIEILRQSLAVEVDCTWVVAE